MLGYLSLDIICPSKLTVTLSENCSLLGADNVRRQISKHIHFSNHHHHHKIY